MTPAYRKQKKAKEQKEKFEIQEYYFEVLHDIIQEIEQVPEQIKKKRILRETLERCTPKLKTLIGNFLNRILYQEKTSLSYLVIDNCKEKKSLVKSYISLVELNYACKEEKHDSILKQTLQDFVQEFNPKIQQVLCWYFDSYNAFGILKEDLTHLYESKELTKHTEVDFKITPLEDFLAKGVSSKYIIKQREISNNIISDRAEVKFKSKNGESYEEHLEQLEQTAYEKRKGTTLKFPCAVFNRTHSQGEMLYFFKSFDTYKTNIKGLMLENIKSVLHEKDSVTLVGFLKNTLVLDTYICSYNDNLAYTSVLDKVWDIRRTTSLTTDLVDVERLFKKSAEENPLIKSMRINPEKGLFLNSLHGYLNYLIVNKAHKVTALFRNGVISASEVISHRCMLEDIEVNTSSGSKMLLVRNVMTKELYKISLRFCSEDLETCRLYLKKEVSVVSLNGKKYLLIKRLKSLTWTYEEFYVHDKKIVYPKSKGGRKPKELGFKKSLRDM